MVDKILPVISILKGLVLSSEWPTIDRIKELTLPILFISGRADELIPPEMMDDLYKAATKAQDKTFFPVAEGTHMKTWISGEWDYIHAWEAFIAGNQLQ